MADFDSKHKTVQEMEMPDVKLDPDSSKIDTETGAERPMGQEYVKSRNELPEKQLFEFAEYR